MLIVDQTNQRFELRPGSNVIGRGTDVRPAAARPGHLAPARRHPVRRQPATAYDLGSTNGTTVNGHEISSQPLRHGDVVRVGHTRIVFHQDSP